MDVVSVKSHIGFWRAIVKPSVVAPAVTILAAPDSAQLPANQKKISKEAEDGWSWGEPNGCFIHS